MPLIEKRRGLSPGGRFPPNFIHQVEIALKIALDARLHIHILKLQNMYLRAGLCNAAAPLQTYTCLHMVYAYIRPIGSLCLRLEQSFEALIIEMDKNLDLYLYNIVIKEHGIEADHWRISNGLSAAFYLL